jgi:hypothetical protein
MMAFFIGARGSRGRTASILSVVLGLTTIALPAPARAADIEVVLDQARLVKLPEKAVTIVIGNPLIADATVQPGGLLVVTGKSYGTTNIIALDRGSAVLLERTIEVRGPREAVVVYRGVNRESYNCTPICEPRIAPGDAQAYFEATINQTTTRSSFAQGNAPTK